MLIFSLKELLSVIDMLFFQAKSAFLHLMEKKKKIYSYIITYVSTNDNWKIRVLGTNSNVKISTNNTNVSTYMHLETHYTRSNIDR